MKNFYNITKGQLITLWVFGVIGMFIAGAWAEDYNSGLGAFFAVLIPFAIVFYTIGWRNNNREEWGKLLNRKKWWDK